MLWNLSLTARYPELCVCIWEVWEKRHVDLVLVFRVGGEEGRVSISQFLCSALQHCCPSQEKFIFLVLSLPLPLFYREKPRSPRNPMGLLPLLWSSASTKSTFLQCKRLCDPQECCGATLWDQLKAQGGLPLPVPGERQQWQRLPQAAGSRAPCERAENPSLPTPAAPCDGAHHTNTTTERTKYQIFFFFLLSWSYFFAAFQLYAPGSPDFYNLFILFLAQLTCPKHSAPASCRQERAFRECTEPFRASSQVWAHGGHCRRVVTCTEFHRSTREGGAVSCSRSVLQDEHTLNSNSAVHQLSSRAQCLMLSTLQKADLFRAPFKNNNSTRSSFFAPLEFGRNVDTTYGKRGI